MIHSRMAYMDAPFLSNKANLKTSMRLLSWLTTVAAPVRSNKAVAMTYIRPLNEVLLSCAPRALMSSAPGRLKHLLSLSLIAIPFSGSCQGGKPAFSLPLLPPETFFTDIARTTRGLPHGFIDLAALQQHPGQACHTIGHCHRGFVHATPCYKLIRPLT